MKRIFTYLGSALALSLIVFTAVSPAYAASASSGLSITPRKNLIINPGQSATDKLTIGNLNKNSDLNVTLRMIDFTYTDDTGTPKLSLAQDEENTAWSLKPFTTLPTSVVIPAGKSKTVEYTVAIPKNQGAGSYYSAIQYGTTGSEGGNLSLSASGVSLVFVSVPGVVNEKMTLQKFGAYQPNKDKIGGKYLTVATNMPEQVAYTLKNEGNVAEAPVGSITVKYMFGAKTWNIDNANINGSLALIGQSRLFPACIEGETKDVVVAGTTTKSKVCKKLNLWPGRYSATLDVFYGQNGNNTHEVNGGMNFWYLPWWFIATFSVLVALIAFAIFKIVRKLRGGSNGSAYRRK